MEEIPNNHLGCFPKPLFWYLTGAGFLPSTIQRQVVTGIFEGKTVWTKHSKYCRSSEKVAKRVGNASPGMFGIATLWFMMYLWLVSITETFSYLKHGNIDMDPQKNSNAFAKKQCFVFAVVPFVLAQFFRRKKGKKAGVTSLYGGILWMFNQLVGFCSAFLCENTSMGINIFWSDEINEVPVLSAQIHIAIHKVKSSLSVFHWSPWKSLISCLPVKGMFELMIFSYFPCSFPCISGFFWPKGWLLDLRITNYPGDNVRTKSSSSELWLNQWLGCWFP